MKKKKLLKFVAVATALLVFCVSPVYAYRRVTLNKSNYAGQLDRIDGCWLATARNFVVAQQSDNGPDSERTVMKQYDEVCKDVKGTVNDVQADSLDDLITAMELFDEMLGYGEHYGDYVGRNGQKDFDFIFDELAEYANPVAISLGSLPGSNSNIGHDVLLTGVDDGTNFTEFVRIYDNEEVIWMQFYDLQNGKSAELGNRRWIATTWCK